MSRTLFGAAAIGATLLGAPAFANAGLDLAAELHMVNALPDLANWAMVGLGFVSLGFAGPSKRNDDRFDV
jgi:uncharacterized membrane protein